MRISDLISDVCSSDLQGFARTWNAVVFDRASGGAGFSGSIGIDPVGMLTAARNALDCTRLGRCGDPVATKACPRCVLGSDRQPDADDPDRAGPFAISYHGKAPCRERVYHTV